MCEVDSVFYVYLWLREDGTPYYVGKGTGNRSVTWHRKNLKPPKNENNILIQEHPSERDAFEAEKFFIEYYSRKCKGTGCLLNITEGGEGISGYRHTESTKKQMSIAKKGRVVPEEQRKKLSESRKGMIFSEEHRLNLSLSHIGKPNHHKGVNRTEETKRKISESLKGIRLGLRLREEVKEKIRNTLKGTKLTEEHKKKISEGVRLSAAKCVGGLR